MNQLAPLRRFHLLLLAIAFALAGCGAMPDRRLSEDEQSCSTMGHIPGSALFKQCMADLNQRRCAEVARKGGTSHVSTLDCSRM